MIDRLMAMLLRSPSHFRDKVLALSLLTFALTARGPEGNASCERFGFSALANSTAEIVAPNSPLTASYFFNASPNSTASPLASTSPEQFFNTFDYSVNYTPKSARAEIERRLAGFAWTKTRSEFADRMTRESLKQMISVTEEIAFSNTPAHDSRWQQAKNWLDRKRLNLQKFPPFEHFPRKADGSYAARAILQKLKKLDPSKPFFGADQFDQTVEAAISYGWLMSYEVDREYPNFVSPRFVRKGFHIWKFKEFHAGLQFHPFLTIRTNDLVDLLVLALDGKFPIWISHQVYEFFDGNSRLNKEIAKHDLDHMDQQLLGLAKLRERFPQLSSEELVRFEKMIGLELLLTALSQPTPSRRIIAVTGLFRLKHENGDTFSRFLDSMYSRELTARGAPIFSLKYFQDVTSFFGEFRGHGPLVMTEENQSEITAVTEDLIATYKRVAPQFLHEFANPGRPSPTPDHP